MTTTEKETFEERVARERTEKAVLQVEHEQLGAEVATALGLGWEARAPEYEHHERRVDLVSADGLHLAMTVLTYGAADKGKLHIFGVMPIGSHEVLRDTHSSIKVNPARGAVVIAKEIHARLLADYEEKLHMAEGQLARQADDRRARDASAGRLAAIMPGSHIRGTGQQEKGEACVSLRFIGGHGIGAGGRCYGDVKVSHNGTEAHLDVRVPVNVVERLLAILAEEDRAGLPTPEIPGPDVLVRAQRGRGHIVYEDGQPVHEGDMVKLTFLHGRRADEFDWVHPSEIEVCDLDDPLEKAMAARRPSRFPRSEDG